MMHGWCEETAGVRTYFCNLGQLIELCVLAMWKSFEPV